MLWLVAIIIAYFLFSITSLGDKFLLIGAPSPKTYAFYVGILGISMLLLVPFVGFGVPGLFEIIFCLFTGVIYLIAIFSIYQGLEYFEATRVIPTIGALVPIFTFGFIYAFSGGREMLGLREIIAFIIFILGGLLISYTPGKKIISESLKISAIGALFLALMFVLSKYIYLNIPFWVGFLWIRIGTFLAALTFLFMKEVRQDLFGKKHVFGAKTGSLFIANQIVGAGGFILQSWSISLAPLALLSIINALQGIQYLFLFVFTVMFYRFFKEKMTKRIVIQKIAAIVLIIIGFIVLGVL